MKMFLSQKKYGIIATVAVLLTLCVLFYYVVPAAKKAAVLFADCGIQQGLFADPEIHECPREFIENPYIRA